LEKRKKRNLLKQMRKNWDKLFGKEREKKSRLRKEEINLDLKERKSSNANSKTARTLI